LEMKFCHDIDNFVKLRTLFHFRFRFRFLHKFERLIETIVSIKWNIESMVIKENERKSKKIKEN
jgi:hypothetical protein